MAQNTARNSVDLVSMDAFRKINQQHRSSWIYIGRNWLLKQLPQLIQSQLPKAQKIVLVTESVLIEQYATPLKTALETAGLEVKLFNFKGGENHKTQETLEQLYQALLSNQLTRNDICLALGGGIVGDLSGYAAATYRRGIQFVQCPTTLLAQVDASVGGKVGVNFEGYKNMLGAFYPPKVVAMDLQFLQTLPEKEWACGMAEVIKTALIQYSVPNGGDSENLLDSLKQAKPDANGQYVELEKWIKICCQLKANVVEADPEEMFELREILNLGHTFGHAYEKWFAGNLLHGQAVAFGLMDAIRVAVKLGLILDKGAEDSIGLLLSKFKLLAQPKVPVEKQDLMRLMLQDKKRQSSSGYRLILPKETLGKVVIQEVPGSILEDLL